MLLRRLPRIAPLLGPHAQTLDVLAEELLESTGRPIVDSRNGITTPRLDLFAAVLKLRSNTTPAARRRAVRQ